MTKILLSAALLLLPLTANANWVNSGDWINVDLHSANDKKVVLDTKTGIEWITARQTKGLSINAVAEQLVPGGDFFGWRFPTQDEVISLMTRWTAGFWQDEFVYGASLTSSIYRSRAVEFVSLFGISHDVSGVINGYRSSSFKAALGDGVAIFTSVTYSNAESGSNAKGSFQTMERHFSQGISYSYDYSTPTGSVWLVSDGGVSLSSTQDPTLNANNPNSPINNGGAVADVSVTFGLSGALLGLMMLSCRRKVGIR